MSETRKGGRSTSAPTKAAVAKREVPADLVSYDTERLELVRRTVAKNASDDELQMFMALADRYGLDPFAKEIVCAVPVDYETGARKLDKFGNAYPPMVMATRDGFLAIANRDQRFMGLDGDVVHEKDEFQRSADGSITHTYGPPAARGKVVGAWAQVHRSDRSVPTYFWAAWAEYGEPNAWFTKRDGSRELAKHSPWAKYPSAMILKVAEAMALKRAFSLSGLTSEAEWDAGTVIEQTPDAGSLGAGRAGLRIPQVTSGGRLVDPHGSRPQPGRAATLPDAEPELPPDPMPLDDTEPSPNPDDDIPFGDDDDPPLPPLPPEGDPDAA